MTRTVRIAVRVAIATASSVAIISACAASAIIKLAHDQIMQARRPLPTPLDWQGGHHAH